MLDFIIIWNIIFYSICFTVLYTSAFYAHFYCQTMFGTFDSWSVNVDGTILPIRNVKEECVDAYAKNENVYYINNSHINTIRGSWKAQNAHSIEKNKSQFCWAKNNVLLISECVREANYWLFEKKGNELVVGAANKQISSFNDNFYLFIYLFSTLNLHQLICWIEHMHIHCM